MPIKLLSEYFNPLLVEISPFETPNSLQEKLQILRKENFHFDLKETQTGRTLGEDEIIIDNREYFVIFTLLPSGV
jgi:hypothetical protein